MFPAVASQIVAAAGGGRKNATLLSPDINRVTVVSSVGDSVMLPPAGSPIMVCVINATPNALQIFGSGTNTINGVAFGTGIAQLGNSIDFYIAGNYGKWFVESGLGFAGAFPTVSSTNGITATPAGTQATAVQVQSAINRVTTVATAGDAVKLPLAAAGMQINVINAGAAAMNVFPNSGDAINALAANAAYSIAAGKTVEFYTANAGAWHTVLSA